MSISEQTKESQRQNCPFGVAQFGQSTNRVRKGSIQGSGPKALGTPSGPVWMQRTSFLKEIASSLAVVKATLIDGNVNMRERMNR